MTFYKKGRISNDIYEALMRSVRFGRLVVPEGITELPDEILDGHARVRVGDKIIEKRQSVSRITSIEIPGTVRRIGRRAFAECVNLRQVTIAEGVEEIGQGAFTGCNQLKTIHLPASVKVVDGGSFHNSGLEEPVFSYDKKILIYYPPACTASEYGVPEGVEEIGSGAFGCVSTLRQIRLPRSLRRIRTRAFIDCGFTEVTIPAGVCVSDHAFHYTKSKLNIHLEEQPAEPERRWEVCRITGEPFLSVVRSALPDDAYWRTESFRILAQQCAGRNVTAMDQMGDFFAARSAEDPETAFYHRAENFWRTRAWRYGSEAGRNYLKKRIEEHPEEPIESTVLSAHLGGMADGRKLNALGFLFFEEDREEYSLRGVDAQGVVEVSAYCGEDGPDGDGFGREIEYDWWYLDDCLTLPEGLDYFHGFSDPDKRNNEKRFAQMHDRAAAAGKQRA